MKRLLAVLFALGVAVAGRADQPVCATTSQSVVTASQATCSATVTISFPCAPCGSGGGDGDSDAGPFGGHATLTDGLVSYWSMDEASDGSAPVTRADSITASGNDLTDNNTTASAAGKNGNAASFVAASSEYLSRDSAVIDTAGDFTVAMWMKFAAAGAGNRAPLGTNEGAAFPGLTFDSLSGIFGNRLYVSNGWGTSISPLGENGGVWLLVIYEYVNSTTTSRVQVLGSASNSGVWSSGYVQDLSAITSFSLGRRGNNTEFWDDEIDEVGVWSRVLTAQERTDLYNAGAGLFYGS